MTRLITLAAGLSALTLAGACTQTGTTERQAATGAAIGAAAGAVIGNNTGDGDAGTGAIIGGVIGGAAGAAKGCGEAADCDLPGVRDEAGDRRDIADYDGDGVADANDRYPNDPTRY